MTTTDAKPFPFWKGWLFIMVFGTVASAYIGLVVLQAMSAAFWGVPIDPAAIPLRTFNYMPTAMLFCLAVGIVPVSLCYALIRRYVPHLMASPWTRFGVGLAIGTVLNLALLVFYPPHNLQSPAHELDWSLHGLTAFPYPEVEIAAPIVLMFCRRRWFGLA